MRLTEHELTAALHGTAKSLAAGRKGLLRRKATDPEEAWQALGRYERYQLLEGIGSQVLPVLAVLPDVEVAVGERPVVPDETIREVVESRMDSGGGKVRRAAEVVARVALVKTALANVPPRSELDLRDS